jgi:hypothetical protein
MNIQQAVQEYEELRKQEEQYIMQHFLFVMTNHKFIKYTEAGVHVRVFDLEGKCEEKKVVLSIQDLIDAEKINALLAKGPKTEPETPVPAPVAVTTAQPPKPKDENWLRAKLAELRKHDA